MDYMSRVCRQVNNGNRFFCCSAATSSTIKDAQHHLREKQALQDSRAQPNGNCMTSLMGNNIMVPVADKLKEISLSDDSGIDSPTGDVNSEISRKMKNEEAYVEGFEETAAGATGGGACKTAGKI